MSRLPRVRVAVWVALPTLLLIVVSGLLDILSSDIRNTQLLQDPASHVGFPFYIGAFSHVGVLLWAGASAICLFAYVLLRPLDPDAGRYLLASGLLSGLFALDDLFLIHEDVLPNYLGIDELVVIWAYGLLAIAYFVRWYHRIVIEGPGLLIAAVIFLGASVLVDLWGPSGLDILVEDGLKLLGISCWVGHFARAAGRVLRRTALAAP